MKLIMVTRKVDRSDALAGFAYGWVQSLAAELSALTVITWQNSSAEGLPPHVRVISLTGGRLSKVLQLQQILRREARDADGIFCHMNPEYTIIAAPIARLMRKRLVSWYTHRAITVRRRLLELLAHRIVTASAESFRKPWFPNKVRVLGHGIDTELFKPVPRQSGTVMQLLTIGRLSPVKNYEVMIDAVSRLSDMPVRLTIAGDVILSSQQQYADDLKKTVQQKQLADRVTFTGWVPHEASVRLYQDADIVINLSDTGSLDKSVLEAMAMGRIVLTSNEAFASVLPPEFRIPKDPEVLAAAIRKWAATSDEVRRRKGEALREIVIRDHGLINLSKKIVSQFE